MIPQYTKPDLLSQFTYAINSGEFWGLSGKHDPDNVNQVWKTFRTVVTPEVKDGTLSYLQTGNYNIEAYESKNWPNTSGLYVIRPIDPFPFPIAGSGIPKNTTTLSGTYDLLVVAYQNKENVGWHGYAYDSQQLNQEIAAGQQIQQYIL